MRWFMMYRDGNSDRLLMSVCNTLPADLNHIFTILTNTVYPTLITAFKATHFNANNARKHHAVATVIISTTTSPTIYKQNSLFPYDAELGIAHDTDLNNLDDNQNTEWLDQYFKLPNRPCPVTMDCIYKCAMGEQRLTRKKPKSLRGDLVISCVLETLCPFHY